LKPEIASAVSRGGSRNVFVGQLDESTTEDSLFEDFKSFGEIDKVDLLPKKQIAFIHFTSIHSAIQAVEAMPKDEKYKGKRISYGRDRSAYDRNKGGDDHQDRLPPLSLPRPASPGLPPPPVYGGSPESSFNRTVYVGGLHTDTTYTEVLDAVRGGPVASCKLLPDKNCAFVTFVDPESAMNFYRIASYGQTIHDQKVRVGWGKPGPLPATVLGALARGASRNVYLGGIDPDSVTDSKLEQDLAAYGIVEKVNVISDKGIAFVNFTNIQSAVKAVAALRQDPFYSKFKINYGKDRCARY